MQRFETKNLFGFSGPKTFRAFRETGPLYQKTACNIRISETIYRKAIKFILESNEDFNATFRYKVINWQYNFDHCQLLFCIDSSVDCNLR